MSRYSAFQAISPAVERTKEYLFQPFQWGRFLKLTLVASLVDGGMSSCNFNSRMPSGGNAGAMPSFHWPHLTMPAVGVIVLISALVMLVVIPIGLLVNYLLIRLRFSFFDCVLRRRDRIGEAWSRYHRQAMRYLGMTVLVGIGCWVVLGIVGFSVWSRFKPLFQALGTDHSPHFMDFLPLIGVLVPFFIVFGIALGLVETGMRFLLLPRMALEDASISEAVGDAWQDIATEPGEFLLFWFMKWLLGVAGAILGVLVMLVPILVLGIAGVVVGLVLKAISMTMLYLLGIPALVLAVILLILVGIGIGGTLGTFRRNYALLFYAGRFPQMAEILWPPALAAEPPTRLSGAWPGDAGNAPPMS